MQLPDAKKISSLDEHLIRICVYIVTKGIF